MGKYLSRAKSPLNFTVRTAGSRSQRDQLPFLLDATIFYSLLILVALVAVPYGTVDPWWESLFESAVFGVTILWLVEGLLRRAWWRREHRLMLPLLLLVLFAVIQCLPLWTYDAGQAMAGVKANSSISADPFETWRFAYKLLAITLTFGLLTRYASTEQRLRSLIYLVLVVAVASALFGLFRSEVPGRILGERLLTPASYAQFENRNHFALLVEMAIGLLLGLTIAERKNKIRLVVYVLCGATLWASVLLTHSRGAAISLAVEIPFFFLIFNLVRNESSSKHSDGLVSSRSWIGRRLIATLALAGLLLGAVGASVVLIGGDETISRLELTRSEFNSGHTGPPKILRPQIWQATFRLIKDHPLVGSGFSAYSMAIPRYLNSSGEHALEQAHNDYLELLAGGGVVGGALALWFFLSFAKVARERLRRVSPFYRAVRCGAMAGLFAVAVHSFFDFGLHITINALICSILIVLAVTSSDGQRAVRQAIVLRAA